MAIEWGLPVLLLLCGGYYTIKTKFCVIRNLGTALRTTLRPQIGEKKITTFSSLPGGNNCCLLPTL